MSANDEDSSETSDPETVIKWSTPPQHRSDDNIQSQVQRPDGRIEAQDRRSPSPTDDTPYIRYAIEQLTWEGNAETNEKPHIGTSRSRHDDYAPGLGYAQSIRRTRGPSVVNISLPPRTKSLGPTPASVLDPTSEQAPAILADPLTPMADLYIPAQAPKSPMYPDLSFVPAVLRPLSMTLLMFLCLLMNIAIMFCAIYSIRYNGLVRFAGGLSHWQYFIFGFLAQILGAMIMIYVEVVMSAVTRIAPFKMTASNDGRRRGKALFTAMYRQHLYWPRLDYFEAGEPVLGAASVLVWPVIFAIPLQGALFSVLQVDGVWRWNAVQGVAWTLVAIYTMAIVGLILVTVSFRRKTGLIWDPRSLADIISLLPRSNSLGDYQNTEILATEKELRGQLALRSDRLGYWRTPVPDQDIFYCIAEEGTATRRYTVSREGRAVQERKSTNPPRQEKCLSDNEPSSPDRLISRGTDSSLLAKVYSPEIRFRYIPWFLKDIFLILWPVALFLLYLALLIVAFLPSTALQHGFPPDLFAGPDNGGFSAANFLYSFVPSFLGLILYFLIQQLTITVAYLTPWAELTKSEGAIAERSLLVEYAYSLAIPFATIPIALSNKHYLICILAFVQPLTVLLPVLAGGFLFPFTAEPSNTVLMFPQNGSFYVMLVVLGLYLAAIVTLSVSFLRSGRRAWHLPHSVNNLAEIISFLYASELLKDATFQTVRSKPDLRSRLVGNRIVAQPNNPTGSSREVRYAFAIFKGSDGRSHLGVDRFNRGASRDGVGRSGRGHLRSRSHFSV